MHTGDRKQLCSIYTEDREEGRELKLNQAGVVGIRQK